MTELLNKKPLLIAIAVAIGIVFGMSFNGWYTVRTERGTTWMIHRITGTVWTCTYRGGCNVAGAKQYVNDPETGWPREVNKGDSGWVDR